jgi:hypothetical protein
VDVSEGRVRGNPVIPDALVPSQVRMSILPEPPPPTPKPISDSDDEHASNKSSNEEVEVELREEVDVNPKGTIFIRVFENSPYEVEFTGVITGSEVDMAWRAMMKQYRVWKHTLFNKAKEEEK